MCEISFTGRGAGDITRQGGGGDEYLQRRQMDGKTSSRARTMTMSPLIEEPKTRQCKEVSFVFPIEDSSVLPPPYPLLPTNPVLMVAPEPSQLDPHEYRRTMPAEAAVTGTWPMTLGEPPPFGASVDEGCRL